ncbi:MAG: hypothetical protein XXXJIFNMEKO3_01343 [Candidatus Erwinia impunctatus]|nr:hypothetical protein XXXJIFNMEKO_01343 [Culicoides impunctatus]
MEMLLNFPAEITMLGLWLNSAVQHEVNGGKHIENNSLSLFFSTETLRPIFHILLLEKRHRGILFAQGPGWSATQSQGRWSLLLYNPVTINPTLLTAPMLVEEFKKYFSLHVDLPSAGLWRIKTWLFDQKNGALYHQYTLHPTCFDRDEETMEYIRQRSQPTLTLRDEEITKQWISEVMLDINAVCLIQFQPISQTG